MNRLTKTFDTTDTSTMDDLLSCLMATIEDGLLQSGFIPNEDYTKKDLMAAAIPMVQQAYWGNELFITTAWPSSSR